MTIADANQNRAAATGQGVFALLLLWLSGACLRITVLALPPVIPLLHRDLHLSETDIGWLSSLAPMLFALAAIPGALLIARLGMVPALFVGLLFNAFGSIARAALPNAAMLYATTGIMAAGVAIMQPALPPLVRAWFPACAKACKCPSLSVDPTAREAGSDKIMRKHLSRTLP